MVQLILDELFTIFTTNVVQHVKIYLNINFHEERILSTLAKVNRLLILIEIVQHVNIYLDINFYEERILSTLAKANRLHLLIENCSAA
ncbi:uncharacterized protein OCT59_019702 [Rhizophagus irregularis]|uniref:uncharacterized protein n=1 Tax=Rhizophagus irregularis TaxID=588596 RepID=UPI00331F2616|nr:hypothetical protein OCT59_019702 [Rhizophagus irregularis]